MGCTVKRGCHSPLGRESGFDVFRTYFYCQIHPSQLDSSCRGTDSSADQHQQNHDSHSALRPIRIGHGGKSAGRERRHSIEQRVLKTGSQALPKAGHKRHSHKRHKAEKQYHKKTLLTHLQNLANFFSGKEQQNCKVSSSYKHQHNGNQFHRKAPECPDAVRTCGKPSRRQGAHGVIDSLKKIHPANPVKQCASGQKSQIHRCNDPGSLFQAGH